MGDEAPPKLRKAGTITGHLTTDTATADEMTEMDVEMALLALSAQDMGEPTEDLDLGALSPTEKRVLLDLLRKRLGNVPPGDSPHPADSAFNSGQGHSA